MAKKNDLFESINLDSLKMYNETNEKVSTFFQPSTDSQQLVGLSKINIFIGTNNSGKSRLLRSLFTSVGFRGNPKHASLQRTIELNKKFIEEYKSQVYKLGYPSRDHAFESLESFIKEQASGCYYNNGIQVSFLAVEPHASQLMTVMREMDRYEKNHPRRKAFEELLIENGVANKDVTESSLPTKAVFIPILRSLKISGADNILSNKTKSDYFPNGDFKNLNSPTLAVFDGTAIYDDLKHRLLTSSAYRKTVTDYEIFLSENFFDNQTVQLSPNPTDQTLHIKIGSQKDRKIQDLGDGIQSIIIMSYSGYFLDSPCRIHVEEPELYLHPGM